MTTWDRRLATANRVENARTSQRPHLDSIALPAGLHHDDTEALDVMLRHGARATAEFSATIVGRVHEDSTGRDRQVEITVTACKGKVDVTIADPTITLGFDALTGLPVRSQFLAEVESIIANHANGGQGVGVFNADIDRFKAVNDTNGYEEGDLILTLLASRLSDLIRPDDFLARVGGDGFAIVCPDVMGPAEASTLAERFRSVCADTGADSELSGPTLSMGYAIGERKSDGATLLRESETALYTAKALGRDRCELFDDDLRGRSESRLSVDQKLRHALDNDAIEVHYQPIVELNSGHIIGAEALLRIKGEDGSYLDPRVLVAAAEDSGLIRRIEDTVLRHALTTLKSIPDYSANPTYMSINISDQRLSDSRFPLSLARTLHNAGATAEQIHLEIRPAGLRGAGSGVRLMRQLHALGVAVVIDGLSNTMEGEYVNQVSVDSVKLDRRMIQAIHTDRGRSRAKLVVDAINDRGIDVCALGIETEADRQAAADIGCRFGQGYMFSPPVDHTTLTQLISSQSPAVED